MAGSSPAEAVANFFQPLQLAVSCVSDAVLGGRIYDPSQAPGVMTFARREAGRLVETPIPIGRRPHLLLSLRHIYTLQPPPPGMPRASWTVGSLAYSYELLERDERRVIAYHWHPETPPAFDHLHFGRQFAHASLPDDIRARATALVRAHLPTQRISLQSVIRLAILELRVEPIRDDWQSILRETEASSTDDSPR